MTQSEKSDAFPPLESLGELSRAIYEHQAHIDIVWLAGHGWQVGLSNPGGSAHVRQFEGEAKWGEFDEDAIYDVVHRAFAQAAAEGWL